MTFNLTPADNLPWTKSKLFVLRFTFLYFLIQLLPWDLRFFKTIVSINWFAPHFRQLFDIVTFTPSFFSTNQLPTSGVLAFSNWGIFFLIALAGSMVWTYLDRKRYEYNALLYLLNILLRYRLAAILIAYGFYKFYHLQMPFPSLSNLNTNYGDYRDWKIYFQTLGITPEYETFIGALEFLAGVLLLNRRTSIFGQGIALAFAANVIVVNYLYQTPELVFSCLVLLIIMYLLSADAGRLWNLLVMQKPTKGEKSAFKLPEHRLQQARILLKSFFVVFIIGLGYTTYVGASRAPFKIPYGKNLPGSYGFYNVRSFIINKDTLPYSLSDSLRWQNAIFEAWPTFSIEVNREMKMDERYGDTLSARNIDRTYELAGVTGRRYYDCTYDTVRHELHLQNKNRFYPHEWFHFHYLQQNDSTYILNGYNQNADTIKVVLDRISKKYLMQEGLRKSIKIL